MKNLLLAASAALFSFAAVAQTGPTTVAGQTPADGRAYGQAVSIAAQAQNDKYVKAPKPAKYDKQAKPLTDAEKDAYKAREEARKDAGKDQQEARKDADKDRQEARKDADKDRQEARKDAYKARKEARKDADKDQQDARKDADKSAKMADTRADKMEKHERSARGEHAHGGDHMGHAKEHKEHKMK
jgi:hypothetical protein